MQNSIEGAQIRVHLFTLRIWSVEGNPQQWRARLQDIQSGEVTFFKDWEGLIAQIKENLTEMDALPTIEQPENSSSIETKDTHHENSN